MISYIFIDMTLGVALVKKIRGAEHEMASVSGYRLKVIEMIGTKLEKILVSRIPMKGGNVGERLPVL